MAVVDIEKLIEIGQIICADLYYYNQRMYLDLDHNIDGPEVEKNIFDIKNKREYEKLELCYNPIFQAGLPDITSFIGNNLDQQVKYYDIDRLLCKQPISLLYIRMLTNNARMLVPSDREEYISFQLRSYLICYFLKYTEECFKNMDNPYLWHLFLRLKYISSYTNPIVEDNYLNYNFKINLKWQSEKKAGIPKYDAALELTASEIALKEISWLLTYKLTDYKKIGIATLKGCYLWSCLQNVSPTTKNNLYDYFLLHKNMVENEANYRIDKMILNIIEEAFNDLMTVRPEDKHL